MGGSRLASVCAEDYRDEAGDVQDMTDLSDVEDGNMRLVPRNNGNNAGNGTREARGTESQALQLFPGFGAEQVC